MGTRTRRIFVAGSLALAALIMAAAIAQAVRQDSLGPVWTVGWLPAVLVAITPAAGRDRAGRACWPWRRRPAGS